MIEANNWQIRDNKEQIRYYLKELLLEEALLVESMRKMKRMKLAASVRPKEVK
jgi:hypothetical protein